MELMDAIGTVYPQYWIMSTTLDTFLKHLEMFKHFYGHSNQMRNELILHVVLDPQRLAKQSSFFELSMLNNLQMGC
jgi:hypothetical protein